MQFVVLMAWLCVSNALLMVPGIILWDSGERLWGILLAAGLPALRIVSRYRSRRGYYLLGYNDGPGGDATLQARWINRHDRPQWFGLIVFLEAAIIVLLIVSIITRPTA